MHRNVLPESSVYHGDGGGLGKQTRQIHIMSAWEFYTVTEPTAHLLFRHVI